jgi:transcriptional regulator with XRE-family HTH domain
MKQETIKEIGSNGAIEDAKKLAQQLSVSEYYVNKVLRGEKNDTYSYFRVSKLAREVGISNYYVTLIMRGKAHGQRAVSLLRQIIGILKDRIAELELIAQSMESSSDE